MPPIDTITPERAARLEEVLRRRQPDLSVVFENVHDPHNVSAVLRSCDAVGVLKAHCVYHSGEQLPKPGDKTSGGARKWVDLHEHDSIEGCYAELRSRGMKIYTTHMASDSVSLYDLDLTQPVAFVFGNEHSGISQEALAKADGNFLIPQMGIVQSLNISVACAVSLFEAFRQRMGAGMYDTLRVDETVFPELLREWYQR